MKTINYITYDPWWDTDKTILPAISKQYKVNVFVISPLVGRKYEEKEICENCSIEEVIQKYRDRDIRSFFVAILLFFKILKKARRKSDCFWFIPGYNPFFQLLLYLYLPKERTVISYHDYTPHYYGKRISSTVEKIYAKIKYRTCLKFEKFLFYSNRQCEIFKKDYPTKKFSVCNMPLKSFGDYNPKMNKQRTFLFFGALQEYKRVDLFVHAAQKVNNNSKFIIAGSPMYNCDSIFNPIIDNDRFECNLHFIKDNEVISYFEQCDFLVLPYIDCTQSGPLLIALNYGIPVIASNIPAFNDIIKDGINGFLFMPGDVNGLCECYERAISMNDSQYEAMRLSQLERKKEYNLHVDPIKSFNKLF